MLSADDLLREIDLTFPAVSKPEGASLSFHPTDCPECKYVRGGLEQYTGPNLPDEAIRYLHDELSCLSAKGWRWVLPSYLRRCVTQDAEYDAVETEFFTYNLAPAPEHEPETSDRLSALSADQLRCFRHFLGWCQHHPHWSDYCATEISQAVAFVELLLGAKGAA